MYFDAALQTRLNPWRTCAKQGHGPIRRWLLSIVPNCSHTCQQSAHLTYQIAHEGTTHGHNMRTPEN